MNFDWACNVNLWFQNSIDQAFHSIYGTIAKVMSYVATPRK